MEYAQRYARPSRAVEAANKTSGVNHPPIQGFAATPGAADLSILQARLNDAPRVRALAELGRALNERLPVGPQPRIRPPAAQNPSGVAVQRQALTDEEEPVQRQKLSEDDELVQRAALAEDDELQRQPANDDEVLQQKQARASAATQSLGVPVNDSPALELEAEQMGAEALRAGDKAAQRESATDAATARAGREAPATAQRALRGGSGGVVQRATGILSALKGLGLSTLKAVPRAAKRTFNLGKHLTWDLGRALLQKGRNVMGAAVAPAPQVPLISQIQQADPVFDANAARQDVFELRWSQEALSEVRIALHYMANNIPNVPVLYDAPETVPHVDEIGNRLAGLQATLNTAGAALAPPGLPAALNVALGNVAANIIAANTAYVAFDANATGPFALAVGTPALPAAAVVLRGLVDTLQDAIAAVIDELTAPAPAGLMQEESPVYNWLFGLATKTLDVTGLKEILQGFTNVGGALTLSGNRDLAAGEMASARQVFGSSIDLNDIQLLENSRLPAGLVTGGNAFTVANTIHTRGPAGQFGPTGDAVAETQRRGVLMHEILHVIQEQKQGMLSWIELQWGRSAAEARNPHTWDRQYDYGVIGPGSQFRRFSREQQGAIVQDYSTFLEMHARAGSAPAPADPIHGQRGHGQFQHYQAMLAGLTQGSWALPWQADAWKQALG